MLSNTMGPCNAPLGKVKFYVLQILCWGEGFEENIRDIMKKVLKFIFYTVVKNGDKMQLSLTTIDLMVIWVFKAKFIKLHNKMLTSSKMINLESVNLLNMLNSNTFLSLFYLQ